MNFNSDHWCKQSCGLDRLTRSFVKYWWWVKPNVSSFICLIDRRLHSGCILCQYEQETVSLLRITYGKLSDLPVEVGKTQTDRFTRNVAHFIPAVDCYSWVAFPCLVCSWQKILHLGITYKRPAEGIYCSNSISALRHFPLVKTKTYKI